MPAERGPMARALLLSEQRGELRQQNKSAEGTGENRGCPNESPGGLFHPN